MNDHGEIKIEYDLDQVNERISKIIDNICTIFSSLPTTHFLEYYYKTFCPNLILEEVDEIESNLNIMSSTEPFVIDIKSKIYRKVKEQYSELEECIKNF